MSSAIRSDNRNPRLAVLLKNFATIVQIDQVGVEFQAAAWPVTVYIIGDVQTKHTSF